MNVRVEVLVLPDFIYQLFNDARVQDQIMQQEIVTCVDMTYELISSNKMVLSSRIVKERVRMWITLSDVIVIYIWWMK